MLTISLRDVPKHDTPERRVIVTGLGDDISQRIHIDIGTRVSCRRGSRSTDVNLDVLVGRLRFGPVVPLIKVPAVGIVEVGDSAIVVI